MLTQARLKEVLSYNPETGEFVWLAQRGRVVAGSSAGRVSNGYLGIQVDGRRYLAHRLAWLYQKGAWPKSQVDHADRDRLNNKFSNLREASGSQNQGNRKAAARNRLGAKGVCLMKRELSKPYRAGIKNKVIGYFSTVEEASAAYASAAKEYFGEFAHG